MVYLVEIIHGTKEGLLNPESIAIKRALEESLGFKGIKKLDIRRYLCYTTKQGTEGDAREEAERLCRKYFADLSVNGMYEIASIEEVDK